MAKFSVAKVLRLVKGLKGEIALLDKRLEGCVSWAGDEKPEFDFAEVRSERAAKVRRLVVLKAVVARSNAVTTVTVGDESLSVAAAILRMQEAKGELALLERLVLQRGTKPVHPSGGYGGFDERTLRPVVAQVTWTSALTEVQRAADVASLKARCEALNEALEESNHRTLVEVDD